MCERGRNYLTSSILCREALRLLMRYRAKGEILHGLKTGGSQVHVDIKFHHKELELSLDDFSETYIAPPMHRMAAMLPYEVKLGEDFLDIPKGVPHMDAVNERYDHTAMRAIMAPWDDELQCSSSDEKKTRILRLDVRTEEACVLARAQAAAFGKKVAA